jgi:uncharacterized membrane protein YagU involved in acid resistance
MNRFWKAVLLTTLLAGTLDIISAHVDYTIRSGVFPTKMFYAIAGGAIGLETAFKGGAAVFALGVVIHYFISFSFTLFFFLVYPAVSRVSSNKYLHGLLYAIFVAHVMTFIVLPLTALPHKPFVFNMQYPIGILILTVVFGLPISFMIDKYYRSRVAAGQAGNRHHGGLIRG